MSDEQLRHTAHAPAEGGWQPIPRGGELDADGTTFVQLPPELLAHGGGTPASGAWGPLAAPGTGYAPPAAEPWQHQQQQQQHVQPEQSVPVPQPVQEPVPAAAQASTAAYASHSPHPAHSSHPSHASYEHGGAQGDDWPMSFEAGGQGDGGAMAHATVSGHTGPTGQWSVPAAGDDSVEESGEYAVRGAVNPQHAPAGSYAPEPAEASGVTGAGDGVPGGPGDGPGAEWTTPADAGTAGTAGEAAPEPGPAVEAAPPAPAVASVPEPRSEQPPAQPAPAPEPETGPETGLEQEASPAAQEHAEHPEQLEHPEYQAQQQHPAQQEHELPLPPHPTQNEHPCASYVLRVNGTDRPVTGAWIGESLLYVLRERLGLAGAKDGCSQGECGACSVQVDGRLVASCLVPAATTAGSEIRTVEGLAVDGQPSDVQRALAQCGAVQCGYCVPGMAMTVHDLLEGNHAPTERETRQALCGNLCRCSGYRGVLDAVRQVVDERAAIAAAEAAAQEEAEGAQGHGHPEPEAALIPHQAAPYGDAPYGDAPYGQGPDAYPYGNDPYGQGLQGPHGPQDPYGLEHGHEHGHGHGPYGDGGSGDSGIGRAGA
ncbi:hypothetical protein GCM10010218_18550 [Streptomyces mashuensis]|uniref:2Fe-2S ferredoxin-type domain-containing protein n=1 Tax=Streptomyces mashuensis TaxID=33904 RepID=A0A919B0K8_9ACTN|nr:(2Fe-2S)-binding protein [Streptomyces mashuensis]GHF37275.1 hypothetical protein GCM10010218_18550 [Streptomyces mashuensis]